MWTLFFYHKYFIIGIMLLLLLSIICQIAIGVIYQRLILETNNLSSTKNKNLQQLKLRYSSHSLMGDGIMNVPIFVDHFLNQLKFGPLSIAFLKHLSGQLMLLAVLTAGIGSCRSIIKREPFLHIIPFYMLIFLGLYIYFAVCSFVDFGGKTQVLRTNLIDYLENHMTSRIENSTKDTQKLDEENILQKKLKSDNEQTSASFSKKDADELETLLKEFLT